MGCQLRKRERIVSDIDHEILKNISLIIGQSSIRYRVPIKITLCNNCISCILIAVIF